MEQTISPWLIYWVMQADSIIDTFGLMARIVGFAAIVVTFFSSLAKGIPDGAPEFLKTNGVRISVYLCIGWMFFGGVATLTPSSKTLVTMFAVPTLIQVADDVELDETAKKSIAAVNKLLDAYIEDTPPAQAD